MLISKIFACLRLARKAMSPSRQLQESILYRYTGSRRTMTKNWKSMKIILYVTTVLLLWPCETTAGKSDMEKVIVRMQTIVRALANEVATLYSNRCNITDLGECNNSSYNAEFSRFPNATCIKNEELLTPACSQSLGYNCSALYDLNESNVVFAEGIYKDSQDHPSDYRVIETVCYSRHLDTYCRKLQIDNADFWKAYNIEPPPMFYGSQEGVFRIFPARHWDDDISFDPRTRPWYVAASSGPKSVVLILDTSITMDGAKFKTLQDAAIRVIETLTVLDRVAVIAFNNTSHVFAKRTDGGFVMMDATVETKASLVESIKALVPSGETNFYDAFNVTFETMTRTFAEESRDFCNSAILFFTDDEINQLEEENKAAVFNLVNVTLNALSRQKPVLFFTFSISEGDQNDREFLRKLTCLAEFGVWSEIKSSEDQSFDGLNSYYRLFALGIGTKEDKAFVTLVEPYEFITGGVIGTTLAAPVYHLSTTGGPPLFLGVVGINLPLIAMEKILEQEDVTAYLKGKLIYSTASCPNLNLSQCELDTIRGLLAHCSSNCSGNEDISDQATQCPNINESAYPKSLWCNRLFQFDPYKERVCCNNTNSSRSNDTCPDTDKGVPQVTNKVVFPVIAIIAISVSVALFFMIAIAFWVRIRRRKFPRNESIERLSVAELQRNKSDNGDQAEVSQGYQTGSSDQVQAGSGRPEQRPCESESMEGEITIPNGVEQSTQDCVRTPKSEEENQRFPCHDIDAHKSHERYVNVPAPIMPVLPRVSASIFDTTNTLAETQHTERSARELSQ